MGLPAKVVTVFMLATLGVGCLLAAWLAPAEFRQRIDGAVLELRGAVQADRALAYRVYSADSVALQSFADGLAPTGALTAAVVYSPLGDVLAAAPATTTPSLETLRTNVSTAETGLTRGDGEVVSAAGGFWSALFGTGDVLYASEPVISAVNPNRQGLSAVEFAGAMLAAGEGSRLVAAYVVAEVDAGQVAASVLASALLMIGAALVLLAPAGFLLGRLARGGSDGLEDIRALADSVRTGHAVGALPDGASGVYRELHAAINELIHHLKRQNQEAEAGRKLTSMKADENESRLSEREAELERIAAEASEAKDRLHRASYYDSLTSLPNRALFTEQFRQLLKLRERDKRPLALLLLNLINFRRVNESLGHSVGDLVLKQLAERLSDCVRASDVVSRTVDTEAGAELARLGGDEFAVVLNQLEDTDAAAAVAARFLEVLGEPFEVDGREIVVSASIGIALAPDDGESIEDLLRAAATAVHHGKSNPAGGYHYFSRDMDVSGVDRLRLETELRKSVERGQLQLHYQPQVDTFDGSIIGAEALLRWEHPEFGQVPPYRFIPLAGEIGMMQALGDWVLEESCRQLRAFRDAGLDLPRVAVNVSALEFGPRLTGRVSEVLQQSDLPPASLELGLSEGVLAQGGAESDACLAELAAMGVYLSVDNFGAGHTPLAYLAEYALDEIKLDRGFVKDCDSRAGNAKLVQAIIALAGQLQVRLLAEGVETAGEYQFLSDKGARYMQGYLFSRPIPAAELQEQLAEPWYFMSHIQRLALSA